MDIMDNNVERLHRAIVDAIRTTHGSFDQPVTVSEIYQKLLPYRAARAAVGFEMNADYEYALLRLLAGEGDYARLEPREVQESLRLELDSPNPNVSLFRDYANCDVWLAPADENDDDDDVALRDIAPRNGSRFVPEFVDDADEDEVELAFEPEEDEEEEDLPDLPARAVPIGAQSTAQQCAFCGGDLPPGRLINFCPHCGNDLTRRPCSNCGEILEPMWRFCISCGATATGFDAEAN